MFNSPSPEQRRDDWKDIAIGYAENWGWNIVPLHLTITQDSEERGSPVVRQLRHRPLVDFPSGATADPRQIREWSGFPQNTPIGLLTGTDSGIVAVEIPEEAETVLTDGDLQHLREALPETLHVFGPRREYFLFSLPEDGPELPPLQRFGESEDGLVLHGEGSLIRIPGPQSDRSGRGYTWDFTAPEKLRPLPMAVLSFFGEDADLEALHSLSGASDGTGSNLPTATREPGETRIVRANAGGDTSPSETEEELHFRSGHQLEERQFDREQIELPWLAAGSLSLLSGLPKTAGKSTFVVNLAARLAAGESFLGWPIPSFPVVLLSDLPDRSCRTLLSRLDLDAKARDRLHVVHPADVAHVSWRSLLRQTFRHAVTEGAGLVIVDSLDQFVGVKAGVDPLEHHELATLLTTDAPPGCAVLAVKALSVTPSLPLHGVIDQLGLMGHAADLVLHMDEGPAQSHPTLRRLQMAGRLGPTPSYVLCQMVDGQYRRVRMGDAGSVRSAESERLIQPQPPEERSEEGDEWMPREWRPAIEPRGAS